MVTVVSLWFDGVKKSSCVMILSVFPDSRKFICWSFSSKSVTSGLPSLSAKSLMTAFDMVPPLVEKVSSTFPFFSTTSLFSPLRAEKNRLDESFLAASSAWALSAASSACCFLAFSFMTAAMLSSLRMVSICSAEGWLYQLKPMSTRPINKNPMRVSLFILFCLFCMFFINQGAKVRKKNECQHCI